MNVLLRKVRFYYDDLLDTNKIKSFLLVIKNYNKLSAKKSWLIYVYTNPLIFFFLAIFTKILILIKNKKLINFFLEKKLFFSTIRFLTVKEKIFVANTLKSYNNFDFVLEESFDKNLDVANKLKELKTNGYCNLGKIFSDEECDNFIKNLENKKCFNSHAILQSDGKPINFKLKESKYYKSKYYCFLPNECLTYDPVKNLLKNVKFLVDSYLNFKSHLYYCVTWFCPINDSGHHYVYKRHRDCDDWKHLQISIYWNDIDKQNGALSFYSKSHSSVFSKDSEFNKVLLTGRKGEVFLIDIYGVHQGNPVKERSRIITSFRFGKSFNKQTVVDGFVHTPANKGIKFD